MNHGKIIVILQTNDSNDGQRCGVVVPPARGDTFIFRWISYRVTEVCHTPTTEHGEWDHHITLVLEVK